MDRRFQLYTTIIATRFFKLTVWSYKSNILPGNNHDRNQPLYPNPQLHPHHHQKDELHSNLVEDVLGSFLTSRREKSNRSSRQTRMSTTTYALHVERKDIGRRTVRRLDFMNNSMTRGKNLWKSIFRGVGI